MKKVVYWSIYDAKYQRFDNPIESRRADGFGLMLKGYEYKTMSVPLSLAINNRKRINNEIDRGLDL